MVTKQERTCLCCKRRAVKSGLLRFVATTGASGVTLVFDAAQRLQGRGAYIHREFACLRVFGEPGRWEWALRQAKGSVRKEMLSELHLEVRRVVTP